MGRGLGLSAAAEDPEPPHEALLLDGKMQTGDVIVNMPQYVWGGCSEQTLTGVPNMNNAIVWNHLIAPHLSVGPSIPDPPQLHFLRPRFTPHSYQLTGLHIAFLPLLS